MSHVPSLDAKPPVALAQYHCRRFTYNRGEQIISHDVYRYGKGPPVVLLQELTGIDHATLQLADRLTSAGFEVIIPHLFGALERTSVVGNLVRLFCLRREIYLFRCRRSSPIVDWLRALCRDICQQPASAASDAPVDKSPATVGVLGLCLSGNFALSMVAEPSVTAAVIAAPTLPLRCTTLPMSDAQADCVKQRLDDIGPIQAYRYSADRYCKAGRFATLDKHLNTDNQKRIALHEIEGDQHSLFTGAFIDEHGHPTRVALDQVLAYFRARLIESLNN